MTMTQSPTQSQTPGASHPRAVFSMLLFVALDIVGIVLFFTGVMWFVQGEPLLIPGFPTRALSASVAIGGGLLLMVLAASRILLALSLHKQLKNKESGQ
jgi:hypothetical protein